MWSFALFMTPIVIALIVGYILGRLSIAPEPAENNESDQYDPYDDEDEIDNFLDDELEVDGIEEFEDEPDDVPLYDAEIGIRDYLPYEKGETWLEVDLSDCKYGCKVYQNNQTGRRILAHNSAYGCREEA